MTVGRLNGIVKSFDDTNEAKSLNLMPLIFTER